MIGAHVPFSRFARSPHLLLIPFPRGALAHRRAQALYRGVVELLVRLAYGLMWSALIAGFALRRGSLSRSGALAALAIGAAIYVGGGGAWFIALLVF
ncbi:MAG TPA: hypothetical protein VG963_07590, partial [Polyangiaceae bacterium]|nr:hypothetical protein [Polyangiaceae bacterium]